MKEIFCADKIMCLYKSKPLEFIDFTVRYPFSNKEEKVFKIIKCEDCMDDSCRSPRRLSNLICSSKFPDTIKINFCPSCYSKPLVLESHHTNNLVCSNPYCPRYTVSPFDTDSRFILINYDGECVLKSDNGEFFSTTKIFIKAPQGSFSHTFLKLLTERFSINTN